MRSSGKGGRVVLRKGVAVLKAIAKARMVDAFIPLSVTMSLTGQCNYRCVYCRLWTQKKDRMPTRDILRLIDELKGLGMQRIGFTQDEPLLHDEIGRIIDFCRERDLFVTLGTNGSLVEKRIRELKNLGVLILSLDGPPEIHDRHRVNGAHSHVLRAIESAKSQGIEVWTTTVLTKYNVGCVDYILDSADRLRFKAAFQILYHSPSISGDILGLFPRAQAYRSALKRIAERKREGRPVINSHALLQFLSEWPDYSRPFSGEGLEQKRRLRCWAGRLFIHVESNGDLFPCSQLVGQPSGWIEKGLPEAVKNASKSACRYCCLGADYIEYNLLFSLHPEAIWNARKTNW
jgi:MoaA/NifB/PqqE/SkfB family radical SAM enzyme